MTELTRRTLLGSSAAGAAALAVGPAARASAAAGARDLYTRRRFTRLRGRKFQLTDGARTWQVKLTHVTDLATVVNLCRAFGHVAREMPKAAESAYIVLPTGLHANSMSSTPTPVRRARLRAGRGGGVGVVKPLGC